MDYIGAGGTHLCDTSTEHISTIPRGSLKFHGCDKGGFVRIKINKQGLSSYYYFGGSDQIQYTVPTRPPRTEVTLNNEDRGRHEVDIAEEDAKSGHKIDKSQSQNQNQNEHDGLSKEDESKLGHKNQNEEESKLGQSTAGQKNQNMNGDASNSYYGSKEEETKSGRGSGAFFTSLLTHMLI